MFHKNKKLTNISIAKYEYPKITVSDDEYHASMEKRLRNPEESIPYYNAKTPKSLTACKPKEEFAKTILIYAHSFTDCQLMYGYDGFLNMYEWLEFTLNSLTHQNVNIIVKGHPNFWAYNIKAEVIKWDRILWNKIKNKYQESKSITFINSPITNKEQLDLLDLNKTVVISHHGNAAVEAAYLGFKSISSSCSPWGAKYYSFCETWSSREQYKELLYNLENIGPVDAKKLRNFISDRYIYKRSYHGELVWFSILAKEIGISTKEISANPSIVTKDQFKDYFHTIRKVAASIHEFPST